MSELKEVKQNIFAILYPKRRNKILYEWCHKNEILIWDEDSYINSLMLEQKKMKQYPQNETFILEIHCSNIEIMVKISKLFVESGYNSWSISDLSKSYLYGIDYIPENIQLHDFVESLCHNLALDILILFVEKKRYELRDLAITMDNENIIIEMRDKCKKIYKFDLNHFVELIELVVNVESE